MAEHFLPYGIIRSDLELRPITLLPFATGSYVTILIIKVGFEPTTIRVYQTLRIQPLCHLIIWY